MNKQKPEAIAKLWRHLFNAKLLLTRAINPLFIPRSQIMKLDANGNAACWQGYVARIGFGITRIRNQTNAAAPKIGRKNQLIL
ncbi:MAG: hypothetical protein ACPMAG_07950 [Limisphaerales bacterium]